MFLAKLCQNKMYFVAENSLHKYLNGTWSQKHCPSRIFFKSLPVHRVNELHIDTADGTDTKFKAHFYYSAKSYNFAI